MRKNKQSQKSKEELEAEARQYLKDDQEAFDHVQAMRAKHEQEMNALQALANVYQQGMKAGGQSQAKEALKQALLEVQQSEEQEKAEE